MNISDNQYRNGSFLTGTSPWTEELLGIRENLSNDLNSINTKITALKATIESFPRIQPIENREVVQQFVYQKTRFEEKKRTWEDDIRPPLIQTEQKIKFLAYWADILKLRERFLKTYLKYTNVIDGTLKAELDTLDLKIKNQLTSNQNSTLENHEQYNLKFNELNRSLVQKVEGLKEQWIQTHKQYEMQLKSLLGKDPEWRLRWESPDQAYNDLYELVRKDCQRILQRLDDELKILNNDVLYTTEVLNHKKALQNKEVDTRLKNLQDKMEKMLGIEIESIIRSDEKFALFVKELGEANTEYSEINKDHRSIIKPTPVTDPKESLVLELLDKSENSDMKKIIIEYQNKVEGISLANSRDEVLQLIKELFIKKQVTIQVKKGKV